MESSNGLGITGMAEINISYAADANTNSLVRHFVSDDEPASDVATSRIHELADRFDNACGGPI